MSSEPRQIVVAGHQPNFFPWFGYFEKMLKADIFVFSDDVRFPKRNYVNRVEIPTASGSHQWCLPVHKGHDEQIAGKRYLKDAKTIGDLLRTARFNLGGLPHSADIQPFLEEFEAAYHRFETLADINIAMIELVARELGIGTQTLRGTGLGLDAFHATDRLIRRLEILNAQTYLSGRGAHDYTDTDAFVRAGRTLIYVDCRLGPELFGDHLRYSVLAGIALVGLGKVRDRVQAEIEGKGARS